MNEIYIQWLVLALICLFGQQIESHHRVQERRIKVFSKFFFLLFSFLYLSLGVIRLTFRFAQYSPSTMLCVCCMPCMKYLHLDRNGEKKISKMRRKRAFRLRQKNIKYIYNWIQIMSKEKSERKKSCIMEFPSDDRIRWRKRSRKKKTHHYETKWLPQSKCDKVLILLMQWLAN